MSIELIPLCTVWAQLEPVEVGPGPAGSRIIWEVPSGGIEGERLNATVKGRATADWMVVSAGGVGTLDVRATFETDDGAVGFAQYNGRVDMRGYPESVGPVYVAPRFEIADPRYEWLNFIQAIGKGEVDENLVIRYEWSELK